jgi:hypothetical protein
MWTVEVWLHTFLTWAQNGCKWSASRSDRFTLRKGFYCIYVYKYISFALFYNPFLTSGASKFSKDNGTKSRPSAVVHKPTLFLSYQNTEDHRMDHELIGNLARIFQKSCNSFNCASVAPILQQAASEPTTVKASLGPLTHFIALRNPCILFRLFGL